MLHVFHSNQVERLIDALTANIHQIRADRSTATIFEKTEVIVPNWNLETYIKFQIAQRTGIAANLRFQTLENFLKARIPQSQKDTIQIVSDKTITLILLELLADENFLKHPELTPIKSYLTAGNRHQNTTQTAFQKTDSLTLRRFQLASQLAKIFREYDYARQEMLQSWHQKTTIDKAPFDKVERWQRHLWLAVFGPEGKLARLSSENQKQYLRLSELFAENSKIQIELPAHTHIFGLSYVAPLFEKIFTQFKARPEAVYLYTLNPCEAFWEDVQPGNGEEDDNGLISTTGLFDYERDTPALRRWGRPGRDNTRMLNRLSETVHETHFFADLSDQALQRQPPHDLTLLQTLQEDIRQRTPERPPAPQNTHFADTSIQFLACPSVQREAEIVANEIWHLIEQSNGTLRFNDIAVIVNHTQRDLYQTHIRAVFKDTHDIAHNITDIAATTRFRVFEAVELLFSLPFGDFRRRELLKLITHPNTIAGPSIPADIDPEQWLQWCNDLNILHGADHEDHAGTYIQTDLYNWDQGMRRLALGAFMTDATSSNTDPIFTSAEQRSYIPLEHANTRLESSASLITLVRSLIADARFCRTAQLPLADWTTLMSTMLTTYLGKSDKNDTAELLRCHQKLAEIKQLDITHEPVPYRVAYQFMRAELDALESQSGQYLVDGVVVTSFLPMRPIPFKVVFVTGMGEGKFPVTERQNPLDLKLASWREGDVNSRDQDKYMFLETLISTREKLYLSWVSRDNRTGDPLEPSSVVKELQYMLQGYESPEFLARRLIEHPLRRYDRAYFPKFYDATEISPPKNLPNYGKEAREEAILSALHHDLHTFAATNNLDFPTPKKLQQFVAPEIWHDIHTRLKSINLPTISPDDSPSNPDQQTTKISLPIRALRKFLECPLQASALYVANLYDYAEPDLFAAENERFETERFPQSDLLTDVFLQYAATPEISATDSPKEELENLYDTHAEKLELLGILPTGLFKDAERGRHLNVLNMWAANLKTFGLNPSQNLQTLRFGRATRHQQTNAQLHPAIRLNIPGVLQADGTTRDFQVELFGETQALNPHHNLSVSFINRKGTETRDFLPGFFDHILLSAAGLLPNRSNASHTVFLNPTEILSRTESRTRVFHTLTQQEAHDYLTLLTRDLLSGIHDYLMPIEAVIYFSDARNHDTFAKVIEDILEQNKSMSSLFGPVRRLERFAPPNESLVQTIINARFAPFLKSVEEVEA